MSPCLWEKWTTELRLLNKLKYIDEYWNWRCNLNLHHLLSILPKASSTFHSENASNVLRPHLKTHSRILNLRLRKTRSANSQHCYGDVIVLEKLTFQNIFLAHENRKPVWRALSKITENDLTHTFTKPKRICKSTFKLSKPLWEYLYQAIWRKNSHFLRPGVTFDKNVLKYKTAKCMLQWTYF